MKKPVIVALCCLLALSTGTAAFAEEPTPTPAPELVELSPEDPAPQFYPDSISWQEDGGQLLVVKQYSVPYGTTVADLTESTMQWNSAYYTLWGVTQDVEGGVTEEKEVTQDLNDFFSLEDGKYGRGILNNCKIKIILNLEEEEAQRVQSVLKLTDAEIDNITRFERGSALIVTNSNNVTVDMRCSEEEKDLITTDRDELRRIVERKMQNQTETEES